MNIIEVLNLFKDYNSEAGVLQVLKGIELEIKEGDFVSLMGPSGSGKSTLMNILGILDNPTSGKYILNGIDIQSIKKTKRAELRNKLLGFVFQGFHLLPRFNLLENVSLPLVYANIKKDERLKKANDMLKSVGLEKFILYFPNQISGGQQQRVAIARALINNPKVILADEPTGNLDTKTSYEIMEIFKFLNIEKKITIVLVTHEYDIAKYSNRVIRFLDGKIYSDGKL